MNNINYYLKIIALPHLQHYLFPVKIVFIIISVFLFAAIIYFLLKTKYLTYVFADWIDLSLWKKKEKGKRKANS